MIQLPKSIDHQILNYGQNHVTRFCDICDIQINENEGIIESENPFIVCYNNQRYFFTKSENDIIPNDCEYAIITHNKPSKTLYKQGKIKCIKWLRHPVMQSPEPDEIINSWTGKFTYKKEGYTPNEKGLRSPQLGALYAYMSEAQNPKDRNIIVMPTGTGKTETMLSILIANQCKKVLITVPSDALREQLANKFLTLGILKKYGIVDNACHTPRVAIIKEGMNDIEDWCNIIDQSNVIVTTMALISSADPMVHDLLHSKISHLFIDEAHHSEAATWDSFINGFAKEKVTLFTATPFRNDGKKLKGNYIYRFSLRDAQEQGYYKPITLIPFREYNESLSDAKIAQIAVEKLRADIAQGYDHIVMARCSTKKRALEVFEYYKTHEDLSPIVIYTGIPKAKSILENIKSKKHKIIVCVNMLGEGFDLPEMKIAAIHDAKQSLPVTLQFIGRFTRTAHDANLGNASVILNIAQKPMELELMELYSKDADWNILLPRINDSATDEQVNFNNFIKSFKKMEESIVPFQSIRPALSCTIYDLDTSEWHPNKWQEVFSSQEYDYRFADVSDNGDTMVIVLGRISNVDFGNLEDIQDIKWGVVLVHMKITPYYKHLYINTSLPEVNPDKLAKVISEDKATRITGPHLFRIFYGVNRFAVQTFGGRKMGDVSFKSYYGREVEEGIKQTEKRELTKNNIFGIGYRNGEKISIGCSVKGKVWSYMRGNIQMFCKWCENIGKLVADNTISDDIVMQNTLHVIRIGVLPPVMPIAIDWDADVYRHPENRYRIIKDNQAFLLSEVDLNILNDNPYPYIDFSLSNDSFLAKYRITYSIDNNGKCHYEVLQISGDIIKMQEANDLYENIIEYFNTNDNAPVIYFADGGILYANNYVKVNKENMPFDPNNLIGLDWDGVDLKKEAQDIAPYNQDSIQYYFAKYIKDQFDVIYDDDYCGEIADLIGFKIEEKCVHIHLYHLKFANGGIVSNQISNFYEVCGQAEKCLKWRRQDKANEIFDHLFRRINKTLNGNTCSRIIKGSEDMLEKIAEDIRWKKELKFHIAIVQPSLSKATPSDDILNLLGAVQTYLIDEANINLEVYCSK